MSDPPARAGAHVFWLPHCSTCQKAVQHLHARGVRIDEFRDLKAQPLQESEVRELARKVGGVDALFSRRAMKYRQMGLHERELGEDEMVRLMTEEYTFVTRPVIVMGECATAGFAAKRIDAMVGGAGA